MLQQEVQYIYLIAYFFNNFAVNAAVAYIENLGTLAIDNWTISFNIAILTGIIQVTDTVDPVLISNSQIYKNTIVTYNATLTEINNPNVWINLCFASEGYIKYLSENKNVLIGKVDNPMNNHIDNLHTLWYDFKFSKYFKHIIYRYGVRFKV